MKKTTWIMIALLSVAGMAQAATRTWIGNTDTNFATLSNWSPELTIVANTPVFGAAGSAGTTLYNDLAAASVINGFTFTTAADSYTLNGNAIKLGGAINAAASTVDQVFNFDIDINQGVAAVRNITASTNGADVIFNGAFTGTGGLQFLVNAGTGSSILTGNNTYNGKTQINGNGTDGARVIIEHDNALGTPAVSDANDYTVVGNVGSLQFRNNITVAEDIRINGAGGGVGALRNLSGTNTLTGPVSLNGNSSIYSAGGLMVFDKTDGVAIDGQNNNIDLRGGGDIQVNGVIAGTGTYTAKSDAGTLSLFGLNTFSNRMRIYKGTVVANTIADTGVASSLGTGDNNPNIQLGNVNNDATLRYVGAAASSDRQFQIGAPGATATGGGIIESSGTGAMSLTATEFNSQQSGVTVDRTIALGGDNVDDNTISGIIQDNDKAAGGTISVAKNDAGKWILSGDNTYSGTTTINAGTLQISHANALGSLDAGTTVGGNGTLLLSGGISLNEALTVAGTVRNTSGNNSIENDITAAALAVIRSDAGTLTVNGNINGQGYALNLRGNSDMVVNGVISGDGSLLAHGDTGTLSLLAENTFNGQMRMDRGVVIANTIADAGVASSLGQGTELRFGFQNNEGGTLQYIGAAASTDRQVVLGTSTTDSGHTAGGKIENNGTGALSFTAAEFNVAQAGVTATRALTLGGSNADANSILGVIADNDAGAGGTVGLIKADANTWILSGDNTYSGETTIDGGKLVINGDQSLATGGVSVNANGILGGSGTIGGAVTVNADGTLSAGNSPGTLTFNDDLTLLAGSTNIMEITDSAYDILMGNGGALAIAGETIFDFTGFTGGVTNGFSLSLGSMYVNWGSVDLTGATYSSLGLSGGQSLDFTGGNLTVIPEPATLGLVVALGGCLVWVRRMFMI